MREYQRFLQIPTLRPTKRFIIILFIVSQFKMISFYNYIYFQTEKKCNIILITHINERQTCTYVPINYESIIFGLFPVLLVCILILIIQFFFY